MLNPSRAFTLMANSSTRSDVQHRRANVDFNVKRGIPLYTPVRKNLRRAERLLRNMSVVAEIQSAIALIRKHRGASRSGIEQFVANRRGRERDQWSNGPHALFLAVRSGHHSRRTCRHGIRLPSPWSRCFELRRGAASRAACHRRPVGHARIHVYLRRFECELRLDAGGRGTGRKNVRAAPSRHDRARPGRDVAQ